VKGWPTSRDVWLLAALLMWESEGALEVMLVDEEDSLAWFYPDGTVEIEISERLSLEEQATILLEELGHYVLSRHHLIVSPPASAARPVRLLKQNDARDEAKIRQFVLAWRFPTALVASAPTIFDFARVARCSMQDAEARWRMIHRS
jgi:hypothetical protein